MATPASSSDSEGRTIAAAACSSKRVRPAHLEGEAGPSSARQRTAGPLEAANAGAAAITSGVVVHRDNSGGEEEAPSAAELDIVWEEVARLIDGRTKIELEVKDLRRSVETLKFRVKHLEWDNKHLEKHLRMVTKKYEDLRKKNE